MVGRRRGVAVRCNHDGTHADEGIAGVSDFVSRRGEGGAKVGPCVDDDAVAEGSTHHDGAPSCVFPVGNECSLERASAPNACLDRQVSSARPYLREEDP